MQDVPTICLRYRVLHVPFVYHGNVNGVDRTQPSARFGGRLADQNHYCYALLPLVSVLERTLNAWK